MWSCEGREAPLKLTWTKAVHSLSQLWPVGMLTHPWVVHMVTQRQVPAHGAATPAPRMLTLSLHI